ncbi:MAG: UDP-N-acetylmuramate--L-alanine ligase [Planctomycetota bacterium]
MTNGNGKRVHFMGIGGIGMSAAASLARERGYRVSGCDLKRNRFTDALAAKGCRIEFSHDPAHLEGVDIVVYSSAVPEESPELAQARARNIPVYKRAIFTLKLMGDRRLIGVTGSHGKTTTTWMVAHTCIEAGLEPSMMVGGTVPGPYGNFRIGTGPWFVSEVDESDGTITEIRPHIAVVTNVDREHLSYYGTAAALEAAVAGFCAGVGPEGTAVLCGEDPVCRRIAGELPRRTLTYGWSGERDIHAAGVTRRQLHTMYDLHYQGETYRGIRLAFAGEHNVLNSLAAFGALVSAGLTPDQAIRGLETCRPVARRFEMAGSVDDVLLINDYAHHPTEIKAVMATVDAHLDGMRKIYVVQPHRYTRLRDCWAEFVSVLSSTKTVIVLPVYSANEDPIEGVSSQRLAEELVRRGVHAEHVQRGMVTGHVETLVRKGDCVVFLGAGDIAEVYHECARRLGR